MTKPNFFLVGAPKCGTTSMYAYLADHPEVFMSRFKEPHFFGSDLGRTSPLYRRTRDEYLGLFAGAGSARVVGEASAFYLYSERAPEEIQGFSPESKILIMLRNPADVVPSLHAEMVYSGVEPERNLVRALDLEPERLHAGRPVSPRQNLLQSVHYLTYMRRLPGQIERYRAVFGPSRVKVVLLDDLKRSPEAAYADVLSFLDVDPHYRPDFSVRNAHKVVRNEALRNWMAQNQMRLGRIRRRFFKRSLGITDRLKRLNTRYTAREEIDPELRGRIVEALRPAVRELEDVLERDLSGWRG